MIVPVRPSAIHRQGCAVWRTKYSTTTLELPGGRIPWTQDGVGPTQVLFRPNDARIVSEAEAQLRGVVVEQFFLGDRTRLHVSGVADKMVVVETSEHREFRVGQSVGLRIEPGALLRLRD